MACSPPNTLSLDCGLWVIAIRVLEEGQLRTTGRTFWTLRILPASGVYILYATAANGLECSLRCSPARRTREPGPRDSLSPVTTSEGSTSLSNIIYSACILSNFRTTSTRVPMLKSQSISSKSADDGSAHSTARTYTRPSHV
ncbi:hypothetical protein EXIGLDRAFT_265772 [Exidia glandulosa HHB12029]|uniref:Uncharacterized protein n=1 Tax=Exidia glandulosa HHB12029 TaxID=1314781 RepID=A0A165M9K0_EXIGL|nr:hypothetical protein EXIGLDRAFT_265772 [Exidia glandulosa HHB12029]